MLMLLCAPYLVLAPPLAEVGFPTLLETAPVLTWQANWRIVPADFD